MRFIVPVAIDNTSEEEEALPERFRDAQWERLPDGRITAGFVAKLTQMVRDYRKPEGTAA
jgi:hypothetical protein